MGMVVRTNTMSANAYRQLGMNNTQLSKSLEKLSSGYRINRAGDDASGLAISEKMKAQIAGLNQASANAQDGISLVQTAEGALTEVHSMLNRMVELADKSANGTIQDDVDRDSIQTEVDALKTEITRVSKSTNFNGIQLLDGSLGGGSVSADGASFTGSKVAASEAATITTATIKADMTAIDTSDAKIDYLSIDGKKVSIDYTNNAEAKALASALDTDLSGITDETGKQLAQQLQDTINNAASDQGVSASVTVKYDTAGGTFTITSDNKGVNSEFSFLGSNAGTDVTTSLMSNVIKGGSGDGLASINKAVLKFDGKDVGTTDADSFSMVINGVTVNAKLATAISGGATATEMDDAATSLQTAIQTAVDAYNDALGLTAGTTDSKSGLTGLTKEDFTVTVGDNGNFKIAYTGDQDVTFSFKDIGDRTIASQLGLAGGSSSAGGNQGLTLQIGDTSDSFNKVTVSIDDLSATGLGIDDLDVSTQDAAADSIQTIKDAINQVSTNRGNLGALQNRLEHAINNLDTTSENMDAANSRIRDTDMAKEMMNYTKMNILSQAAQAMLAQANQQPQNILQLLQ